MVLIAWFVVWNLQLFTWAHQLIGTRWDTEKVVLKGSALHVQGFTNTVITEVTLHLFCACFSSKRSKQSEGTAERHTSPQSQAL